MQVDFHYAATYALARAAGLGAEAALTIATSSQYVDDATERTIPMGADHFRVEPEVTAHRVDDLRENTSLDDQPRVWVPFHSPPAARGRPSPRSSSA